MRATARRTKGATRASAAKPAAVRRAAAETGTVTPIRRSPRPAQALTLGRLPAARQGEAKEAPPDVARQPKRPEGAGAPGAPGPLEVVAPEDATEDEARRVAAKVEAGEAVPPIAAMPPTASTLQRQEEDEPTVQEAGMGRPPAQRQEPLEKQGVAGRASVMRAEEQLDPSQVQALARAAAPPSAALDTASAAAALARSGEGQPLDPALQRRLEGRLGSDLADVRVHTDEAATAAATALDARAFAVGRDIYLGAGEDPGDAALMAHEVTHTVQQTGGTLARKPAATPSRAARAPAGRAPDGGDEAGGAATTPDVELDRTPPRIRLPRLAVPTFKVDPGRGLFLDGDRKLFRAAGYQRGNPGQARKWEQGVKSGEIAAKLRQPPFGMLDNHPYLIRVPGRERERFERIGDPATLAPGLVRPFWTRTGAFKEHHVDHIAELQMSGWPRAPEANELGNMEMLDDASNEASGRAVRAAIISAIDAFRRAKGDLLPEEDRDVEKIKKKYDVLFERVEGQGGPASVSRWDQPAIEAAEHLPPLANRASGVQLFDLENDAGGGVFRPAGQLSFAARVGSDARFVVYRRSFGGSRFDFDFRGVDAPPNGPKSKPPSAQENARVRGMAIDRVTFTPDPEKQAEHVGTITGTLFKKQQDGGLLATEEAKTYQIRRIPSLAYAGFVDSQTFATWRRAQFVGLSPVEFESPEIDDERGLVATGRFLPDVPLIGRAELELILEGDELRLEKRFELGDFDLPGPVKVTESDLAISIGTRGAGVDGAVKFEIERVGQGELRGRGRSGLGDQGASLMLAGRFDFDSELFDPARIAMKYENKAFSGEGEIGIKRGKVRGIRSASAKVSYENGTLSATGTVEPDIKGVESGTLELTYSEAGGLVIAGALTFGKDIPKVKGGSLSAKVERRPGEEGYKLSGTGRAELDIEGVDSGIEASYDDGAFTLTGRVGYEKGLAKGEVTVGVSNRALDDAGQPSGEPTDELLVFGRGEVTLTFTPWLKGTVGLEFRPDGEIVVSGEVRLPASFEVFPQRRFEKNVFTIGLDIPIVGVTIVGQRIGIFATISGGLDVGASIGPGALRELSLGVVYNPAHEDQTAITGRALFAVPAQAGLRLFVRGALGAGIPVVSASAGLEIGGGLGLEGEARAGVEIDWTPATGLALEARGELFVEPKLKFDITGFVLVEADLLFTTVELYEKRWRLAGFELGSGLRFGIVFPVSYRQGEPFDISLDDIEFQVPPIEPARLLENLIDQIA